MQPPSGKGKHKPTCIGNVCMTVKRWFKALLRTNGQARYRPALCIAVHAFTCKRKEQHATLLEPCANCSAASNPAKNGEINRDKWAEKIIWKKGDERRKKKTGCFLFLWGAVNFLKREKQKNTKEKGSWLSFKREGEQLLRSIWVEKGEGQCIFVGWFSSKERRQKLQKGEGVFWFDI